MKKVLLTIAAVATLGACSTETVVDTLKDAIVFDNAFVDNATRAAYDGSYNTANLESFEVYATITGEEGNTANIFNKETVVKGNSLGQGANWSYSSANTQYWIPGNSYTFRAIADGNVEGVSEVVALEEDKYLATAIRLNDASAQRDILVAEETVEYESGAKTVRFTFAHTLAKAKFTVNNKITTDNGYSYKVTDLKMSGVAKNGVYDIESGTWGAADAPATYDLAFGNAVTAGTAAGADAANLGFNGSAESNFDRLLIPGVQDLNVSFTYELLKDNVVIDTQAKNLEVSGLTLGNGKAYNFVISLGNPGEPIQFDVEKVNDWDTTGDSSVYEGKTVYVDDATEFAAALNDYTVTAIVLNNDIEIANPLTRAGETDAVIAKSFVLDGNGKTLTYTGSNRAIDIVSEVENATDKDVTIKNITINCTASYVERGINYNANGTLVLDGVKLAGTVPSYAVNFPGKADNAVVTINNCELTGKIALNVWGENMRINVENSVLTSVDNTEEENYSAVKLNNDGSTVAEGTIINIKNSKVVARDEKGEPSSAFNNGSETGSIIVDDATEVVGETKEQVAILYFESNPNQFYGCTSLAGAIASSQEHNATGIRITRDIELDAPVTIAKGQNVVIDLNGKTIFGVDKTEKNYELIKNTGNLTIFGGGKLTVEATINSGWNRYSAVIANTVGGNLTVKDVAIEHFGGTDMAYGIDNLTNGKGTYAVTTIEGATVKSTYRAVRQFLNGIEATNELYVKAGSVLEGPNKSIFFHDPSKNANTGKLVVEAGAQLKGDVYLFVTEGSTEWPVEVSIAESAFVEGIVTSMNVPAGYLVTKQNGNYVVVSGVTNAATQDDLNAAIADGATIVLAAGTYNMPSTGGKNIAIVGTKETVINAGASNMGNGNVTLEGVTITAGSYKGFQHSGVVTYNDVTVKGQLNCYGKKDIFNNCTFELNNTYVWTYGSDETEFNGCTFNTNGKAILIYNEGAGACNVTVKNCTFNATAGGKAGDIANQNCAAIEISNYAKMPHVLTTSGNTYSDNFSGEWRIKSYVAGAPVTVNGVEYTSLALDGKKMTIDTNKNVTVIE